MHDGALSREHTIRGHLHYGIHILFFERHIVLPCSGLPCVRGSGNIHKTAHLFLYNHVSGGRVGLRLYKSFDFTQTGLGGRHLPWSPSRPLVTLQCNGREVDNFYFISNSNKGDPECEVALSLIKG